MTDEQAPATTPSAARDGLRSRGMRDLGPEEMQRFRRIETRFLEVTARAGYQEIRTPTVEPLHLFTGAGALSPQMLDRVYSFLDWDGWSGERVVLRPDSTLPAVRWYEARAEAASARLCYVQPVYRFAADEGEREQWQCGVELFGLAAPEGDIELLLLARDLLTALGLPNLRFEVAHVGLMRAVLAATGLDTAGQLATYDRLLEGNETAISELVGSNPDHASGLRTLFEVHGGDGYLANLRTALLPSLPDAANSLDELEKATRALRSAGCDVTVMPATTRGFEYYTGVTFRALAGTEECASGGRYDRLAETIGGHTATASGFAADLLRLTEIASPEDFERNSP